MDLYIQIEDDKIWSPGKTKIGKMHKLFREKMMRLFTAYMASVYATEMVIAIDTQRYKTGWDPLSPQWLTLKEEMGWSDNIWEATSKLKESITWWPVGKKGFAVGIDKKAIYKRKNGKPLAVRLVCQWMEYGTGDKAENGRGTPGHKGMPPRPLFRPLRKRLSKDLGRWFDKFLEEYSEDIDDIIFYSTLEAVT